MKSIFIRETIKYTGAELTSHFAYKNFNLLGDSIISFIGPCRVKECLVDLEDSKQKKFIYSSKMLHFIVEHFDLDLEKGIFRQRLLISIIQQILNSQLGKFVIKRQGDDLFDGKKKLSVSIATLSSVSSLIHVGLNIKTSKTPVLTCGLEDYEIAVPKFAQEVMDSYIEEIEDIKFSRCKVRGVK